VTLTGCGEFVGGETNNDPNSLSREQVQLEALLPPILVESGEATFNVGFTFSQYAQYTSFEATTDEQEPTRLNGAWTNIYLRALNNAELLVEKAREAGSPHYLGIAKVVQAYNLGLATTAWEDVPWTEAFVDGELTPAYDEQEQIYTVIDTLLDGAIRELEKPPSEFTTPGSDDIIYGGNEDQWIRLANALRARYSIHLINKGAVTAANEALTAATNAMIGNQDDFQIDYNGERNLNPYHTDAVLSAQTGNPFPIQSDQIIDMMNGNTYPEFDPRLSIIADKGEASEYLGSVNGTYGQNPEGPDNSSTVNFTADTYHSRAAAPIFMMTYAELKFLEAEAQFLVDNGGDEMATGASPAAYQAYLDGIRANMDKLGVAPSDRDAYLSAPSVDVGPGNLTMELILKEKYKALFLNPEAFNDLRRYDFDSDLFRGLELPENHNPNLNGQWIKRALYPSSELGRNSGEVPNFQPEDPMWFMTSN
jgi:hypothetical protein